MRWFISNEWLIEERETDNIEKLYVILSSVRFTFLDLSSLRLGTKSRIDDDNDSDYECIDDDGGNHCTIASTTTTNTTTTTTPMIATTTTTTTITIGRTTTTTTTTTTAIATTTTTTTSNMAMTVAVKTTLTDGHDEDDYNVDKGNVNDCGGGDSDGYDNLNGFPCTEKSKRRKCRLIRRGISNTQRLHVMRTEVVNAMVMPTTNKAVTTIMTVTRMTITVTRTMEIQITVAITTISVNVNGPIMF